MLCNQFGHSVLAFVRTAPGSLSLSGSFRKALPSFLTRSHSMARDCGPHKIDPGPWKCMMKTKRQEFITKPFTKPYYKAATRPYYTRLETIRNHKKRRLKDRSEQSWPAGP